MLLHGDGKKEGARLSLSAGRIALLAMLLCCALVAGYMERSIPFDLFLPGVKLGLSNVVILFALYQIKPYEVFILAVLKSFLTSVFMASFTAFAYSICGTLLSFSAMAAILKINRDFLSPVGVSVVGAICHNIGQIIAASFILGSFLVVAYLPILLISGVIAGIFVGIIVRLLIQNTALANFLNKYK